MIGNQQTPTTMVDLQKLKTIVGGDSVDKFWVTDNRGKEWRFN